MTNGGRTPIGSTHVCPRQPSLLVGLIVTALLGGPLSRQVVRAVMESDVASTMRFVAAMFAAGPGFIATHLSLLVGCGLVRGMVAGTWVGIVHWFVLHRSIHVRPHCLWLYPVLGAAGWGIILGLGYSIWNMRLYWFLQGSD